MPNPNGNRLRCKVDKCINFASKDGWCKRHRPAWAERNKTRPFERENFIDKRGQGFRNSPFFSDKYGIVRDKCRALEGD